MITQNPISAETQQLFSATFLLDYMAKNKATFDTLATDGSEDFASTLQWLLGREYVAFDKKHRYAIAVKGKQAADHFAKRYQTLLTYFDVFAHVDLEAGSFAYQEYQNFDSSPQWQRFLQQEQWEDMRIPLIQHLGGSALELVFCQFVKEERIDTATAGWQYEMANGIPWSEILDICNSALTTEQLSYDDGSKIITGEHILDEVAAQGFALLRDLYPDDIEIHSDLAAWYPQHGVHNPRLNAASSTKPIWQKNWQL